MDEKKRIPVAEADGWIPVQEGLPKKSDYYLVTRGRKRITTMLYFTRGKWWSDSLCQDRWPDYMILAWQPRPKPYMGGADEFICFNYTTLRVLFPYRKGKGQTANELRDLVHLIPKKLEIRTLLGIELQKVRTKTASPPKIA